MVSMSTGRIALAGARVLVTGAAGFIGARVVEKLVSERGARVRALARDVARAERVRGPSVELVRGDVTDAASIERAARDCDVVIHCAYGAYGPKEERRRATVEGTRNVLAAARMARARRVVHLSTVMVYGLDTPDRLDENSPRVHCGDAYADAKVDAESIAFRFFVEHALPVTVLQPTAVYGPFGGVWTTTVIEQLSTGLVPLIDGGRGIMNTVYVDDVADAVLLAAERPETAGEAFLISGGPVTYGDFYRRFERMLGDVRTVSLSSEVALARVSRASGWRARWARWRRATSEPVHALTAAAIRYRSRTTVVSTEKARRLLGYVPRVAFDRGMQSTETWARETGLLRTTREGTSSTRAVVP